MHWNCPHCSTRLHVDPSQLKKDWSFARCYRCQGFSLIRQSVAAPQVGVKQAEALPVAQRKPKSESSKIDHHQNSQGVSKAQIIAPQRKLPKPLPPLGIQSSSHAKKPRRISKENQKIQRPLGVRPKAPKSIRARPARRSFFLPFLILLSAGAATSSGYVLYQKGVTLWSQARVSLENEILGQASGSIQKARGRSPAVLGTGLSAGTDTLRRGAMAPFRKENLHQLPKVQDNGEIAPSALSTPSTGDAPATLLNTSQVRIQHSGVNLRMGPGTQFAKVGKADPKLVYEILGWEKNWFRIAPIVQDSGLQEVVWVRNDYVVPTSH